MHDNSNRRRFLQQSIGATAAIGIGSVMPDCFSLAAAASNHALVNERIVNERILVVVQISGGNDGLNTIVPYADERYRAARPKLAIAKNDVLRLDDHDGLHPSLGGMNTLLQDGKFAAIRSVGYENPNRSHFESMDIWHTCRRKDQPRPDGWLGRYLDRQEHTGGDIPALHLGREQQPAAIASTRVRVPTVTNLSEFQLRGGNRQSLRALLEHRRSAPSNSENELLGFLQSSTQSAIAASVRVTQAASDYRSDVKYPDTELARKLRVVAQLIDAGL
ncbi:MAG: hypothetical protein AAFP90_15360, partial [Planctomycetota bacterium]